MFDQAITVFTLVSSSSRISAHLYMLALFLFLSLSLSLHSLTCLLLVLMSAITTVETVKKFVHRHEKRPENSK